MPPVTRFTPPGDRKRDTRPSRLVAAFAAALAVLGVLMVVGRGDDAAVLDADLCPRQGTPAAHAVYLVDAHKPLDSDLAELPGKLLRRLTLDLGAGAELEVYAVGDDASAPLSFLGRICKPYDNAQMQVASAKDRTTAERDCDDLPAQIPPALRDAAERFCGRRAALERRVDELVARPDGMQLVQAPLAEAFDAAVDELAAAPGSARALYVLSDMLHHTPEFSHVDGGPRQVIGVFAGAAGRLGKPERALPPEMDVEVFYVPRAGLTDEPGVELAHKRFWRRFFPGAVVSFTDQPTAIAFRSRPTRTPPEATADEAVPTPAAADSRADDLAGLRAEPVDERSRAEQLLAEIVKRQAEIAEAEQRLDERWAAEARRRADELAVLREERRLVALESRALAEQAAAKELPLCALRQIGGPTVPDYPGGGVNIGSATVAVDFDVGADGRILDSGVRVDAARSTAERGNLDAFTDAATAFVGQWAFEVPPDDGCHMRQSSSVRVEFRPS